MSLTSNWVAGSLIVAETYGVGSGGVDCCSSRVQDLCLLYDIQCFSAYVRDGMINGLLKGYNVFRYHSSPWFDGSNTSVRCTQIIQAHTNQRIGLVARILSRTEVSLCGLSCEAKAKRDTLRCR